MKKLALAFAAAFVLPLLVGCEDTPSTEIAIEKSELEKYVEENPVPVVTGADFDAVNADE